MRAGSNWRHLNGLSLGMMGDPVRCLPKVVHPDVAALKLQHNPPGPLWLSKHLGLEKQATAWQAQQQQLSTQVGILTEQYAHITEDYKKLAELLAQA